VGRHDYQKGYDRLLLSWRQVATKFPDWQLHIYGKKDISLGLEDLAGELGITNSVFFYDPIKSITEVYQKASVFVLSSRYEGFGMVLTEAMSHGVPCVSFDCPHGPADIIDHEENGLLVKNGDVLDFALQIEKLIAAPTLRKTMGEKAVHKADSFSQEAILPQWHTLFTNLITNH
jgi:glycosyltransferase involved in cell wall biosynthesis